METMLKEGGIMLNNKPINRKKLFACYTTEEKHAIVQAYLNGMRIDDIVIKYNTSSNAILKFVKEEGHQLRRLQKQLTEEEKAVAIELYKQGNSLHDISVTLKKGYFLVRKAINEADIMRPNGRPYKKENK